jgi:tetratricopeptide (TPR) repeat protein
MSTYFPISLRLDAAQEKELLQLHESLGKLFEKALPLAHPLHEALKQQLSNILHAQPEWAACIADSYTQRVLALQHPDSRILNLPWEMALTGHERLYLSKNTKALGAAYVAENPLPLKILVMVSSPEDSSVRSRLSFEEEELAILRACRNLFETGQVQIDFTEDGSLHNLRQKLKDNHYHILHFSGHGVFHEGQGYLELEDEFSQQRQLCTAQDFAATLSATPVNLPALVLLSSCQSAQAGQDSNFSGVAQELLRAKVPAVLAMGWSILDRYANGFAEVFYQALAEREALPQAFQKAILNIQQQQNQELALAQIPGLASQWFIPQLYLAGPLDKIANLEKGEKKLRTTALNFTMKDHPAGYYFVGRRRDKRTLLPALFAQQPIWLQGQGGLGKSSLAEHLVQRLLAKDSAIQPFVLDENSMDLLALRSMLYAYFKKEHKRLTIEIDTQRYSEKAPEQVLWLLTELSKVCKPLFIFDNLESFQVAEGNPEFAEQYQELLELLQTLCSIPLGYLIFTGRYPAPAALQDLVLVHPLREVSFADFWKKTQQLRLVDLRQSLLQQQKIAPAQAPQLANYEDLIQWLYRTFGGNYRALEFFDEYFAQNPAKTALLLADLAQFPSLYAQETQATLQRMSANLVFERLLALLDPLEQQTLGYLRRFRRPVLPLALGMQDATVDYQAALQRLLDLTLIEAHVLAEEENLLAYYAPPLVKNLLDHAALGMPDFNELKAGAYFEHIDQEINQKDYVDLEEAFEYYLAVADELGLNRVGLKLSYFYYRANLFAKSLHFSLAVHQTLQERTQWNIVNLAGLVFDLFGNYERALQLYQRSLGMVQQIGDRSGEGTTLNNISQIYKIRGDYDRALVYLEQSLAIRQQIGDRSGEGITLSNISQIYDAKGDYDRALDYLEQSLAIQQQIGDRSGEGITLNNLAGTAYAKGEYDRALVYLEQSLDIAQQIGDRSGEGTTLNNISQIYSAKGDYDQALVYLEQSLDIQQQIGNRFSEGRTLNNLATIAYKRGEYDRALDYLEQSLAIQQQIGDRSGEGITLSNISQVYAAKGNYDQALVYLEQSLAIAQQIGDRSGEGTTLNNISQIYSAKGDYDQALVYLEQSLAIWQQIGDIAGLATTLANIGAIYWDQKKEVENAIQAFWQAYQIFKQIGSPNVKVPESYLVGIIEAIGEARFQEILAQNGAS